MEYLKEHFGDQLVYFDSLDEIVEDSPPGSHAVLMTQCFESVPRDKILMLKTYDMVFMPLAPPEKPFYRLPFPCLREIPETDTIIPVHDRTIDIFFSGEVIKSYALGPATVSCENASWARIRVILEALRCASIHNLKCEIIPQKSFGSGLESKEYLKKLANTKFALCPRGSVWESYRMIEAALSGCIIIVDQPEDKILFPSMTDDTYKSAEHLWYLKNFPGIIIDFEAKSLEGTLVDLISNPLICEKIQAGTLEWARRNVSSDAVIGFVEHILAHKGKAGPEVLRPIAEE